MNPLIIIERVMRRINNGDCGTDIGLDTIDALIGCYNRVWRLTYYREYCEFWSLADAIVRE